MDQSTAAKRLTDEIMKEFELSHDLCYQFIFDRIERGIGIGYVLRGGQHNLGKAVVKMNMDGETLEVYPQMSIAARAVGIDKGGISKVCLGKKKTAAGCLWRFLDPNDFYRSRKLNIIELWQEKL